MADGSDSGVSRKTIVRILKGVGILLAVVLVGSLSYATYWNITRPDGYSQFARDVAIRVKSYDPPEVRDGLRVITYNIGWAVGPYQETIKDRIELEAYKRNLDEIVRVVVEMNADIVLLQEVELGSDRSYGMDQLDYLQEKLGWKYAACAVDWNRYIPLEGVGKIHKCVAVLSRYPIVKHERKRFTFNPHLENRIVNFFYYPFVWTSPTQYVQIAYKDKTLNVYNLHLSVFSRKNRALQMKDALDWIERGNLEQNLILGGDFNFHARVIRKGINWKDDVDYLHRPPFFQDIWRRIPGIQEAFINAHSTNEQIHQNVTFLEKKQRFDFIFFSDDFQKAGANVIHGISSSDHLPVYLELN